MGHKCCFHNQHANVQRRYYVACESIVRSANMANQKRQAIAKKELAYLLSRLRTIDATISCALPCRGDGLWTPISPRGEGRPGTIVKVQIALTCFYPSFCLGSVTYFWSIKSFREFAL